MWVEILCGLVFYRIVRRFFYNDDTVEIETSDETVEIETSDADAKFLVANRFEKLYGGKAYLGLRIPDADSGSRQNIDVVLVTKGQVMVILVKNMSGFIEIEADGSWTCEHKRNKDRIPDPVQETKKQVAILKSYIEQRGVALPDGYISGKVVMPNQKSRTITINFPSEVICFEEWVKLKPDTKITNNVSGWFKDASRGGKKDVQDGMHQQVNFILGTAPMWDRLKLKENKNLLGEFLEFKGKSEDVYALRHIKRSKVSRLSMLDLVLSKLQVLYFDRDYRNGVASASDPKLVTVRSSTEILFQPQDSNKVRKFKLSSMTSMSLSA